MKIGLLILASMSQNLKSKVFLHFEEAQIWIADLLVAISLKLLFTNYKLTSTGIQGMLQDPGDEHERIPWWG